MKSRKIAPSAFIILPAVFSLFLMETRLFPAGAGEERQQKISETLEEVLRRGEVVIVEEPPVEKNRQFVTAGIRIKAPRAEVYRLVTGFERYPEFFPEVETVTVVRSEGNVRDVRHDLKSGISILPIRFRYTLRFVLEPPGRMTWTLVEGDMKFSDGSWELYEVEGGRETVAFYRIAFDIIPQGFIVKTVVKYVSEKSPVFGIAAISATALTVVKSVKDELEKK